MSCRPARATTAKLSCSPTLTTVKRVAAPLTTFLAAVARSFHRSSVGDRNTERSTLCIHPPTFGGHGGMWDPMSIPPTPPQGPPNLSGVVEGVYQKGANGTTQHVTNVLRALDLKYIMLLLLLLLLLLTCCCNCCWCWCCCYCCCCWVQRRRCLTVCECKPCVANHDHSVLHEALELFLGHQGFLQLLRQELLQYVQCNRMC
jgi:hypothetical protein